MAEISGGNVGGNSFPKSLLFTNQVVTLRVNIDGKTVMNTTLTIDNIYEMLSSLSVSNKKWLADHLYRDISNVQQIRHRGALSDGELSEELKDCPLLDMDDYPTLSDVQYKELIKSKPIAKNVSKWL